MAQGGFIVPSAFIVIQDAFWEFRQELGFDFSTQQDLPISDDTIDYIRNLVDNHELKEELVAEINTRLHDLRNQSPIAHPLLAVRSSGVAEDLDNASFAGMNETVLNVECDCSSVCHAVKECWKSLFTRRSIEYRVKNGFPAFDTSIAVIVQVMIPSEVAGVVFTVDPHTSSRAHLALDGVQGIGEALVSGMVVSDHWTIRKPYGDYDFFVEEAIINQQEFKLQPNYPKEGTSKIILSEEEGGKPSFTPDQVSIDIVIHLKIDHIVRSAIEIEKYYQKPMDIEFSIYCNELYILQARPITHLLTIPNCRFL